MTESVSPESVTRSHIELFWTSCVQMAALIEQVLYCGSIFLGGVKCCKPNWGNGPSQPIETGDRFLIIRGAIFTIVSNIFIFSCFPDERSRFKSLMVKIIHFTSFFHMWCITISISSHQGLEVLISFRFEVCQLLSMHSYLGAVQILRQPKSEVPGPPSVSFRQHLPDAPFVLQFLAYTCLHDIMIKWRTFMCYGPICMLYDFALIISWMVKSKSIALSIHINCS